MYQIDQYAFTKGIKTASDLLYNQKISVTVEGKLYNKYSKHNNEYITSNSCILFFDNNKSINIFFPKKQLDVLKASQITEGKSIKATGNVNLYWYHKNYDTYEETIVSPIIRLYCTGFEILPYDIADNVSINYNPKTIPAKEALQKIALITNKNSEGYRDFIGQLSYPLRNKIEAYNVNLEGYKAITDISNAIYAADADDEIDIICIVRGGGQQHSINSVFDDYEIYSAIENVQKPVFVGIGHAQNLTNADKVSDSPIVNGEKTYYATPSILGAIMNQVYGDTTPNTSKQYNHQQSKYNSKQQYKTNNQSADSKFYLFIIFCLSLYIYFTR